MLGGESPLSRYTWSRRTREAQGRHREEASEGSVERTCGTRNTNRIGGVVQPGRAGTQPQSPPSTSGLCFINSASMHGRYDNFTGGLPCASGSGVPRKLAEPGGSRVDPMGGVSRRHSRAQSGPKARTVGRRGPGCWTEAPHLTSSSYRPLPSKGVKPRLEHRENALQAMTNASWNAWSSDPTSWRHSPA